MLNRLPLFAEVNSQARCRIQLIHLAFATGLLVASPAFAGKIHEAIQRGDLKAVQALVQAQPESVNEDVAKDETGRPLNVAVHYGNAEIARFLLEHGADVNARGGSNRTRPIFEARDPAVMQVLIDFKADLTVKDAPSGDGQTPLENAARRAWAKAANVLAHAGATVDAESAALLGWTEILKEMLERKQVTTKPPSTLLFRAASQGRLATAKLLLDHGADPSQDGEYHNVSGPYTPLTDAVRHRHYAVAELLCSRGANCDVSAGRNHDNLLVFTVAYWEADYARLLLTHGANPNRTESFWNRVTPLHTAAALGGAPNVFGPFRVSQPRLTPREWLQSLEKVELLIQHGAKVDATTDQNAAPLLFAAICGKQDVCDLLLSKGAELDFASACLLGRTEAAARLLAANPKLATEAKPPLGIRPLIWAARVGDTKLATLLVEQGADVNGRSPRLEYQEASGFFSDDNETETPLEVALVNKRRNVAEFLIGRGARLDIYARNGDTPLMTAGALNDEALVTLMLKKGASPNVYGKHGGSALGASGSPSVAAALIAAGADIEAAGQKQTPLSEHAEAGRKEMAAYLISRGAKVDLYAACLLDRAEDVERLLDKDRTQLNAELDFQFTPAGLAAKSGATKALELLVNRGAEIHPTNDSHCSPLHIAAEHGQIEVLELLLSKGVSVDVRFQEQTALHVAAVHAQPDVITWLLKHKADVSARDGFLDSPLHGLAEGDLVSTFVSKGAIAGTRRDRQVAAAEGLIDAGAKLDSRNWYGQTPLHVACAQGLPHLVELFLTRGADPDSQDWSSRTPLFQVQGHDSFYFVGGGERKRVVELLKLYGAME